MPAGPVKTIGESQLTIAHNADVTPPITVPVVAVQMKQ